MNYHDHKDNSKSFRALTGVSHEQFCALLPYFEAAHEDYLSEYEMTGERRSGKRRSPSIYKNSPLPSISDRLFFILVYLKNNPLQEYHAACFGMNQKHCNIFIHCLTKILRLSLKAKGLVPAETDKELAERLAELSKEEDKPVLLHDGTEREIPRPADRDMQKERYSGKKKRHTVKNAVIVTMACLVIFVSQTVSGKTHDKKMADTMYSFPVPCTLYQDTGYQGYEPEGVEIIQPVKKPKGKELSRQDKEYNKKVSAIRVRIEHVIGSAKVMRIVKDECRLRANNFVENIFSTCMALHNLRIKINPWNYHN